MFQAWTFDAGAKRAAEREFAQLVNAEVLSCACEVDTEGALWQGRTTVEKAVFGEVSLYRYSSTGVHRAWRDQTHVDADASDDILIYVPMNASYTLQQARRVQTVAPGAITLIGLDRPMAATFVGGRGQPTAAANIRLPRLRLREYAPLIEQQFMRPVTVGGRESLLQAFLEASFGSAVELDAASAPHLGEALIEILAALVLVPNDPSRSWARDRHSSIHARARDCIAANLANAALGPAFVARGCGVSLRSLHLAFAGSGWTVSAWIREQRLQRCKDDLTDNALCDLTISEIACRWGFADVAHFSRAYRARFGHSPGTDRGSKRTKARQDQMRARYLPYSR